MAARVGLEDPELWRRVIEFGQQGLGRVEIALKLGLSPDGLKAREESDTDFAWMLRRAAEARVVWWHSQIRERLTERFDLGLYISEFQWRFPGKPLPWELDPPAASMEPAAPAKRWRHGGFW